MRPIVGLGALVLSGLLAIAAFSARAEDLKSMPLGAPIKDGALKIGARTWMLPAGEWKLGGRHVREVNLNEIRRGAEVIEVMPALIHDGRLQAGLMMTSPTGSTQISAWREDSACRVEKALLKEDDSSVTQSDCMIIRVQPGIPTKATGAEIYASAAQWLQGEAIKTPRPVLQVLIVKYVASEYFRASCWFDPAVFGLKPSEVGSLSVAPESLVQWAKAYRATISSALGKSWGTYQIPPLPAR